MLIVVLFLGIIDFGLAPTHSHTPGEYVVWLLFQILPATTVQTAQGGGFHTSHNPLLFSAKKSWIHWKLPNRSSERILLFVCRMSGGETMAMQVVRKDTHF